MSINGASTIFCLALKKIKGLWNSINPWSGYRPPVRAEMLVTISQPPTENESQGNINSSCEGWIFNTAKNCTELFLNTVINGKSALYVLVFNFENIHVMSHRSDFFLACSSIVNNSEPAFSCTTMVLSTVSQVEIRSKQIPTARLDSESLNTSLLEVMISY